MRLGELADALNVKLAEAEELLERRSSGVRASVPCGEAQLAWAKHKGERGFWREGNGPEPDRLFACSLDFRILAAEQLPALYAAMQAEDARALERAAAAIQLVERFIQETGSHLINGEFQSDKYPSTPRGEAK